MQSIKDSTIPAHFAFQAFNMQSTWLILMHDGGIFCRQEPAFSAYQRPRAQQRRDSPRRSQRLASQREREAQHREKQSRERRYGSLPHNSCYNCLHDMAIPLTRAKRFAAMRESDGRITSIFHTLPARPPAFYVSVPTF